MQQPEVVGAQVALPRFRRRNRRAFLYHQLDPSAAALQRPALVPRPLRRERLDPVAEHVLEEPPRCREPAPRVVHVHERLAPREHVPLAVDREGHAVLLRARRRLRPRQFWRRLAHRLVRPFRVVRRDPDRQVALRRAVPGPIEPRRVRRQLHQVDLLPRRRVLDEPRPDLVAERRRDHLADGVARFVSVVPRLRRAPLDLREADRCDRSRHRLQVADRDAVVRLRLSHRCVPGLRAPARRSLAAPARARFPMPRTGAARPSGHPDRAPARSARPARCPPA